jgi:hypothetical protein
VPACGFLCDLSNKEYLASNLDHFIEVDVCLIVAPTRVVDIANVGIVFELTPLLLTVLFHLEPGSLARNCFFNLPSPIGLAEETVIPEWLVGFAGESDPVRLTIRLPSPNREICTLRGDGILISYLGRKMKRPRYVKSTREACLTKSGDYVRDDDGIHIHTN